MVIAAFLITSHFAGTFDVGPELLEWTEPLAPKTASGGDETSAHWIADDRKSDQDGTGRTG